LSSCGKTSSDPADGSGGVVGAGGFGSGLGGASGSGGKTATTTGGEIGLPPERSCGDGIVDAFEGCDDGNEVPWDGCTACVRKGDLLWTTSGCEGPVFPGRWDTFLVVCSSTGNSIFERYYPFISGTSTTPVVFAVEPGPPPPRREDGMPIGVLEILELPDGRLLFGGWDGIQLTDESGSVLWRGPNDLPEGRALAAAGDFVGAVGVNYVHVYTLDGTLMHRVIPTTDGHASVHALALAEDGSSFAAASILRTSISTKVLAEVWAHDVRGMPLWSWSEESVAFVNTIYIEDIRLQGDRVRVLLAEDGAPPKNTLQLLTLDAKTGEELERLTLWNHPGAAPADRAKAKFAFTDAFESYLYGADGVTGFDAQGNATFEGTFPFTEEPDYTVALLGVICQTGPRPNATDRGPVCYLTK
jgi:cysteine-rich repeat protein